MGVPVITLAGDSAMGRGSASVLSNVGLPQLVADSQEQYVDLAANANRWVDISRRFARPHEILPAHGRGRRDA